MLLLLLIPVTWAAGLDGALRQGLRLRADEGAAFADWLEARPGYADGDSVVVVVEGDHLPAGDVWAWVEGEDGRVEAELRVPWSELPALTASPGIDRVRSPRFVAPKATLDRGEVVAEGLDDIFTDEDWGEARIRGQGEVVAIVDVGFAGYKGLLGRELPETVETHFSNSLWDEYDHGTAVAEIVHDMAPDADLHLVQFLTDTEFKAALRDLEDLDPDVVNASVGFDNLWPADGSSPPTQAVERLVAHTGAVWVGAAGNEAVRYRSGALSDIDNDTLLEIDGAEGSRVAGAGFVYLVLRWDSPVAPKLQLRAPDGRVCAEALPEEDAPIAILNGATCGGAALAYAVLDPAAPEALEGAQAWLYASPGLLDPGGQGTLTLPADAAAGIAVGACDPASGEAAAYSSQGPTEDGRLKPDLCATPVASTETGGPAGFVGTSAAAPLLAGLATLVVDGERLHDNPDAVADWLIGNAVDLGVLGADTTFGWGAVEVGPAPRRCGCAHTGAPETAMLGPLFVYFVSRRRAPGPNRSPRPQGGSPR